LKRKLLKRKDFTLFRKEDKYCGLCGMILRIEKKDNDFYWCPKCKLFRWPKPPFIYPPSKNRDLWLSRTQAIRMKEKMDKCIIKVNLGLSEKVTIYSAKEFDQEFLKSKIPRP